MFFRKKQKSREQVEAEVRALGWWYQTFELPSGASTGTGEEPSYRPELRWKMMEPYLPKDLSGKTVLDLGANAGYFSVQAKLRGARRCVLVEPYIEFAKQARYVGGEFGVDLEIVNEDVHVYCLTTSKRFDYVIFLGLFYHLKYPVLVLDRLAEMTKERLFFQSHLIGSAGEVYAEKENYAREADDHVIESPAFPRLAFVEKLYNRDPTNWWIPNYTALEPLLRSAGLKVVARPHAQFVVAEPSTYLGKTKYGNLVFPRYGKSEQSLHPGPQHVDPELWKELTSRVQKASPQPGVAKSSSKGDGREKPSDG